MTDPLNRALQQHYETLDRPHDRLRSQLIAALPSEREIPAGRAPRRLTRSPGPMLRYAAVLAVLAGLLGVIAWLSPGPVLADVVFADVLNQIRRATTVSYSTRLHVGDRAVQTARVQLADTGREYKTLSDGGVQISDFASGRIVFLSPPPQQWALVIEYPAGPAGRMAPNPLQRLADLPTDAGRLVETREVAGQPAHVFEVERTGQRMQVFADTTTHRPVRIEIVTEAGATLVMTDFTWDEPLDEALLTGQVPPSHTQYAVRLIDESRPVDEADLIAMLDVLAKLGGGSMPDSLDEPGLASILTRLESSTPAIIDLGTGTILMAGPEDGQGVPAMVRALRGDQHRRQVRRGMEFLQTLADQGQPFEYVGRGVRSGRPERVFWYQPRGSALYRVIYGDSTVRNVQAKAELQ